MSFLVEEEACLMEKQLTYLGNISQECWPAPAFNPRTGEVGEGRSGAQGLPGLQSEFVDGLGYVRT